MQKRLVTFAIALSFALALVAPALANPYDVKVKADIPFDFIVGKKKLPKGEYTISSLTDTGVFVIRNAKGEKAVSFITFRGKMVKKPKAKLAFNRYNDQYFLARVWDGVSDTGLMLKKSSAEKKAAKAVKEMEEMEVGN